MRQVAKPNKNQPIHKAQTCFRSFLKTRSTKKTSLNLEKSCFHVGLWWPVMTVSFLAFYQKDGFPLSCLSTRNATQSSVKSWFPAHCTKTSISNRTKHDTNQRNKKDKMDPGKNYILCQNTFAIFRGQNWCCKLSRVESLRSLSRMHLTLTSL